MSRRNQEGRSEERQAGGEGSREDTRKAVSRPSHRGSNDWATVVRGAVGNVWRNSTSDVNARLVLLDIAVVFAFFFARGALDSAMVEGPDTCVVSCITRFCYC